jgi:hypothetical protein
MVPNSSPVNAAGAPMAQSEQGARAFRRAAFRGAPAALYLRWLSWRRGRAAREALTSLPLVGGMSSIPSRVAELVRILDHIVPQLDRLHLFLHGYETVPGGVARPKVTITLAPRNHPYRQSGKFFGLSQEARPCLYFTFDDDILYLEGHVRRLREALLRYSGNVVVGVHGATFFRRVASYTRDRTVRHFARPLLADEVVDQLGAGTAAFAAQRLPIDPPRWAHGDMDDLMLAIEAERNGLPRIAVARPSRSLIPLEIGKIDSLWKKVQLDDTRQLQHLETLMKLTQHPRWR